MNIFRKIFESKKRSHELKNIKIEKLEYAFDGNNEFYLLINGRQPIRIIADNKLYPLVKSEVTRYFDRTERYLLIQEIVVSKDSTEFVFKTDIRTEIKLKSKYPIELEFIDTTKKENEKFLFCNYHIIKRIF